MVFYFQSVSDPSYMIYMGRDKEENELLIRYAFPEDVWFHVDEHSSAHVYLRLKRGQTLEDIPPLVLMECGQLVKANSIKGNKLDDVAVIYTNYLNLRKTNQMEAGEVGFFDEKAVMKMRVPTRNGPLLRKLEKTKREEVNPPLRQQREDRDAEEKRKEEHVKKEQRKAEAQEKKELKAKAMEQAALREYRDVFANDEAKTKNTDLRSKTAAEYEEDFW